MTADRLAPGRPAPPSVAARPPPAADVRTARPPKTDGMDRILAATGVVVALIATGSAGCSAIGGGTEAAGAGTPAARSPSPSAALYRQAAACIRAHSVPNFPDPARPRTRRPGQGAGPHLKEWSTPPQKAAATVGSRDIGGRSRSGAHHPKEGAMSRRAKRMFVTVIATVVGLALIWLPVAAQAGIQGSG